MKKFEIFTLESDGIKKGDNINILFGYPNEKTKTNSYRDLIKKYDADEWAGIVDSNLVEACANMTPEERVTYYDDSDLKSRKWLEDNNWFPSITDI